MTINEFAKRILGTGIFNTYVATVFFASIIFFVLNSSMFTALEMIFGVVLSTIIFKGVANIMLSMTISFVDLDNQKDQVEFKKSADNLESLVKDLSIQKAAIQSNKNNKNL